MATVGRLASALGRVMIPGQIVYDQRLLQDGDDIEGKLEPAIRSCDLFLIIAGPDWKATNWVRREIGWAVMYDVPSRALLVDENSEIEGIQTLHPGITSGLASHLRNNDKDWPGDFSRLVQALKRAGYRFRLTWAQKLLRIVGFMVTALVVAGAIQSVRAHSLQEEHGWLLDQPSVRAFAPFVGTGGALELEKVVDRCESLARFEPLIVTADLEAISATARAASDACSGITTLSPEHLTAYLGAPPRPVRCSAALARVLQLPSMGHTAANHSLAMEWLQAANLHRQILPAALSPEDASWVSSQWEEWSSCWNGEVPLDLRTAWFSLLGDQAVVPAEGEVLNFLEEFARGDAPWPATITGEGWWALPEGALEAGVARALLSKNADAALARVQWFAELLQSIDAAEPGRGSARSRTVFRTAIRWLDLNLREEVFSGHFGGDQASLRYLLNRATASLDPETLDLALGPALDRFQKRDRTRGWSGLPGNAGESLRTWLRATDLADNATLLDDLQKSR